MWPAVAVGGYGRGELAPCSDIDLLFLTDHAGGKAPARVIEQMLYLLWDLGLKVGHASRTVADTIRVAQEDQTVLTGLLEMRHIAGDARLYTMLDRAFHRHVARMKPAEFVEAKLAERDHRHEKHGGTRYMVEPNIKEGKGGLRDLHTLFWVAKFAYRADSIIDIVDKGILRESEARRFAAAQRFSGQFAVTFTYGLAGQTNGWISMRRWPSRRSWDFRRGVACAMSNAS